MKGRTQPMTTLGFGLHLCWRIRCLDKNNAGWGQAEIDSHFPVLLIALTGRLYQWQLWPWYLLPQNQGYPWQWSLEGMELVEHEPFL